jgi:hypothetical protein
VNHGCRDERQECCDGPSVTRCSSQQIANTSHKKHGDNEKRTQPATHREIQKAVVKVRIRQRREFDDGRIVIEPPAEYGMLADESDRERPKRGSPAHVT